jgi:anti-sigma-K factor RskA
MTQAGDYNDEDEANALRPAEYVLGVLNSAEEQRLREAATRNPELRAQIARWEQNLARIADQLPGVPPPEKIWRGIRQAMKVETGARAFAQRPAPPSLWNNAAFWRGVSFASLATTAAACLVAIIPLFRPELPDPAQSRLVAALAAAEGPATFVATYDPQHKQMLIVPAAMLKEPERVPELWLVTRDKRVISLGVVSPAQPRAVVIPPHLVAETRAGAALVITLEPPGGAPGGVATGPAIATGDLSPI